jgi:hypothetical protein
MFVVAMTTTVLASVGVYALAAAANEVRTSGNERQNTQTHYLAEYGVLGIAHELTAGKAQFYIGLMLSHPDTCVSLPGVPSTASPVARACRRIGSAELGTPWTGAATVVPYAGANAYMSGIGPGSFGPIPMNGDFFIELTEPIPAKSPHGYALDLHMCFDLVTATTNGITQPVIAGQPTGTYANEGIEVQRARMIAGPLYCSK